MADALAPVRQQPEFLVESAEAAWAAPGWHEAAVEYHHERGKRVAVVEIERAWQEPKRHDSVAAATLQAAEYLV